MSKTTLAVIVGNRDFFPDVLVTEARRDILATCEALDLDIVMVEENATNLGGIETFEEAKTCAALFAQHRDAIDGILVALPNFGTERGVVEAIKLSGLDVPILVQASPDDVDQFNVERRRDAFCGKISVCNNLRQYGYPFTLTDSHTVALNDPAFQADLERFAAVCRVVGGLRGARLGAIGARPDAFLTVRYSEKILQAYDITVSTMDLSEAFGLANKLADNDARVVAKLSEVLSYVAHPSVPGDALTKMAKLGLVLDDWMAARDIDATAIQCWDAIQAHYGVNACTLMSMMSEKLLPSACEVDVCGALSMLSLQLASGVPSALVDWNNNYGGDPDKCVLFHCGNWPTSLYGEAEMAYADVLASTLGQENTYGALRGRVPAGPMSFARISTDDLMGDIRCYVGDGQFTDDPLKTFGSRAVVEVPDLQDLLYVICKEGFEHHVAMNPAHVADVLFEAWETYFGWDVYYHG